MQSASTREGWRRIVLLVAKYQGCRMKATERRFQRARRKHLDELVTASAPRVIVLTGFMGVGKTEVGKLCAVKLGYEFCDTDAMVEEKSGRSVAEVFAVNGEAEFRKLERCAISEAIARQRVVIATGGGALLDPDNHVSVKKAGAVVLLTANPQTIADRIGNTSSRPLLAD